MYAVLPTPTPQITDEVTDLYIIFLDRQRQFMKVKMVFRSLSKFSVLYMNMI